MSNNIIWPDGKKFAFTIFDDTDYSTLRNVTEIYSFLDTLGFRTTKSVWPFRGNMDPKIGGSTCDDLEYQKWVIALQKKGFEIGFHNATFHSSLREATINGLERFRELFGTYPKSMSNHSGCLESIYWGSYRLTGINRLIYNLLNRYRYNGVFRGHIESDKYFWGDICKDKIKYVRNFTFPDINTLKANSNMPYFDPQKPFVNYWFSSSEGYNVKVFNNCINEENQDRLEEEGGVCIMYTHFACGFFQDNCINARFAFLMKRLAQKNGWFIPVATLLDYILKQKNHYVITDKERRKLERKWLFHKLKAGRT
jgi:hypothetical protein